MRQPIAGQGADTKCGTAISTTTGRGRRWQMLPRGARAGYHNHRAMYGDSNISWRDARAKRA